MSLLTGLQGYWKLDESSGNAADQVNGNTLTNNNTVTYSVGVINNGANFVRASSKYLTRVNGSVVGLNTITGNLTIAGWMKASSLPALNASYGLLMDYNNGGYALYFTNDSGTYNLKSILYGNIGTHVITSAWTPSLSTWYHVALTFNTSGSNNLKFYVNGSQQGSTQTDSNTALLSADGTFALGAHGSGVNFLDGSLDEWGVWSAELTSSQISQLYNSGAGLSYPFPSVSTNSNFLSFM